MRVMVGKMAMEGYKKVVWVGIVRNGDDNEGAKHERNRVG